MRTHGRSGSPSHWRRATLLTVTALLATACGVDAGASDSAPSASATASVSSAAASATASMSSAAGPREFPTDGDLSAGRYSLSQFPAPISFEIPAFEPPAEWFVCGPVPVEQAVCHRSMPDPGAVAVTFQIVENVVTDPCQDQEAAELLDPPVGPSVDDLVTAISSLEGYEATAPVDIAVDGFDGKEFTLTAPETEGCGATWATSDRTTGMGPGEINLLRVLDVDGARVLISMAYGPETPEVEIAAIQQVMDSVQIEP